MRVDLLADVTSDGAVVYLLARVEASIDAATERNPVNLAVAIDRSSSMRGPRIRQAVEAARELTRRLEAYDRLTIIAFDNSARAIFGPETVSESGRAEALAALDALDTGVGTNVAAAIRKGSEAITSGFVRGALSRLILLTDGQPSVGITDAGRLCRMVEKEYERGVTTTTMGIGQGFEDELLSEMARRGRGGFYYLASAGDIPAAFGRELDGVFSIAASDTQLKFLPHADVVSVEVLHRLPSIVLDEGLQVEIGEVAAGAPRVVLLKVVRKSTSAKTLGTIMLTHKEPSGKRGDPNLTGVELPSGTEAEKRAESKQVQSERLRLAVASAVDTAWARRASSDAKSALLGLEKIRVHVEAARDADEADADVLDALLADMAAAEEAVQKSASERERLRRGMREQSQVTLLGRSVVSQLPQDED